MHQGYRRCFLWGFFMSCLVFSSQVWNVPRAGNLLTWSEIRSVLCHETSHWKTSSSDTQKREVRIILLLTCVCVCVCVCVRANIYSVTNEPYPTGYHPSFSIYLGLVYTGRKQMPSEQFYNFM